MAEDIKAERINPYHNDNRSKTRQVEDMFDNIAPAYDFMNRMMTFGIDRLWRRRAVKELRRIHNRRILDVATGTGDLALLLCRELRPHTLTGIDLSEKMLAEARRKSQHVQPDNTTDLCFMQADCMALPFADESYDCVTVAYGVRNFEHLLQGYREMYRVLAHGGCLCVIELSTPESPLVRPFYNLYTRHIIPAIGRLVSNDVRAYSYLPESIAAVPQGDNMLALMQEAGFSKCRCISLTFGVCSIYLAIK